MYVQIKAQYSVVFNFNIRCILVDTIVDRKNFPDNSQNELTENADRPIDIMIL